jgi:hypothetical protein
VEGRHPPWASNFAICYISEVSSEKRPHLEKTLADVEEATEQRMHSVGDLVPGSEQIHERADRLSESAQEHYRRAQRGRADDANRMVNRLAPANIFSRSSCLRTNHG